MYIQHPNKKQLTDSSSFRNIPAVFNITVVKYKKTLTAKINLEIVITGPYF
jgi:hypothetical protein